MELAFSDFFMKGERKMQVFISQPMHGLSEMQILDVRNKICNKFHITEDELIENYVKKVPKEDVNEAVWCLGDSIRLMAFADLVIPAFFFLLS